MEFPTDRGHTRAALQIQDRSPQLRPVPSECVCDWLRDATGLDCGDRSWICNAPKVRRLEGELLTYVEGHLPCVKLSTLWSTTCYSMLRVQDGGAWSSLLDKCYVYLLVAPID